MLKTQKPQYSRLVNEAPIFYGVIVWIVALIGVSATAPGQSFTVSLFFDHFINDFDLDRTTVSSLYGLGTFIASLTLTWVGRQIDRHGNRRTGVLISGLFALAVVAMSQVNGALALMIGFMAIRGLGQGSLFLVNSTAVAQWFRRWRGLLMSMILVGFSLFQAVYLPQVQLLLERMHWRQVWVLLGIGVAATILPLTWIFMRDKPEDFGLQPDGTALSAEESLKLSREDNWSLREAMRTPLFWTFAAGRFMPPAWITGLIIHQISIFDELGYAPIVAAETLGQVALFTAAAALLAGTIVDRVRPSVSLAVQLFILAVALVLANFMTQPWLLIVYAVLLGVCMGIGNVFDGTVWVNLFGREHQGAIRGFVTTVMVAGTAAGPVVFGMSFDMTGSYQTGFYVATVVTIIPALLSLLYTYPKRRGHMLDADVPSESQ